MDINKIEKNIKSEKVRIKKNIDNAKRVAQDRLQKVEQLQMKIGVLRLQAASKIAEINKGAIHLKPVRRRMGY